MAGREWNEGAAKIAEDLRKAAKELDRPRSSLPRPPRKCKPHSYILSDRCDYCGTPMPDETPDEKG